MATKLENFNPWPIWNLKGGPDEVALRFDLPPDDVRRCDAIIARAQMLLKLVGSPPLDWIQTAMDLRVAVNHNPGRIDLQRLIDADVDTFARDVGALVRFINRRTGIIPESVVFLHQTNAQKSLY